MSEDHSPSSLTVVDFLTSLSISISTLLLAGPVPFGVRSPGPAISSKPDVSSVSGAMVDTSIAIAVDTGVSTIFTSGSTGNSAFSSADVSTLFSSVIPSSAIPPSVTFSSVALSSDSSVSVALSAEASLLSSEGSAPALPILSVKGSDATVTWPSVSNACKRRSY